MDSASRCESLSSLEGLGTVVRDGRFPHLPGCECRIKTNCSKMKGNMFPDCKTAGNQQTPWSVLAHFRGSIGLVGGGHGLVEIEISASWQLVGEFQVESGRRLRGSTPPTRNFSWVELPQSPCKVPK